MTAAAVASARVITGESEPLWFLGTLARLKLTREQTGGRFALWEGVLPRGAAPPLHSHPQDETFVVLAGSLTGWLVPDLDAIAGDAWLKTHARACGVGDVLFAPAGVSHAFRIESSTAHMLFLSTPAGIEEYVRALAEPAVPAERMRAVEEEVGMVRLGPSVMLARGNATGRHRRSPGRPACGRWVRPRSGRRTAQPRACSCARRPS